MAEMALMAQARLRDGIHRMNVAPAVAADVLALAASCHEANVRRRGPAYSNEDDQDTLGGPVVRSPAMALAQVPTPVAPFCHDVCLYRAFMGLDEEPAARRWLGAPMWGLVQALGGWARVHRLSLGRLCNEAHAAKTQMPTFLQPPTFPLMPVELATLRELIAPWSHKVAAYRRLRLLDMTGMGLTAGAWLWLLDRAHHRLMAEGDEGGACRKLMASAYHARQAVGLLNR